MDFFLCEYAIFLLQKCQVWTAPVPTRHLHRHLWSSGNVGRTEHTVRCMQVSLTLCVVIISEFNPLCGKVHASEFNP